MDNGRIGVVLGVAVAVFCVLALMIMGGGPSPLNIAVVAPLTMSTSPPARVVTPVPTMTPTPAPTALPNGYVALAAPVVTASFDVWPDPARAETALRLDAGMVLKATSERQGVRCRAVVINGEEDTSKATVVWLDCDDLEVQP